MGRILFFLVALIAVVFAVLIFAPGVVPAAAFKERIEAAASNAVGRDVTIGDNLSFRILPRTAFRVDNLTVANAPGFEGAHLMRVSEADIGVKLIKLITEGAVEVDRFVLTEPDINLVRKPNGAVNWNLSRGEAGAEQSAEPTSGGRDLRLGDVRIVNGRLSYRDQAASKNYLAENANLRVILSSLKEPLEVDGDMVFQGAPATIEVVLTTLDDLIAKKPTNLKLDMKVDAATAGADVDIATRDALRYRGPVRLDAPDLPAFAALLGAEIADAPGFDRLSLSGAVDGGAKALRLSDAKVGFDDIDAQGALSLDWAGARPKAGGVLSTDEIDLRAYLPPPSENAQGFPEWSKAKMDFTGLRNIDADFDISTNAIYLNDLKFGESRLKIRLDNGRMTADIPELSMYGGQGSGRLVVNARGGTPSFAGNFDLGSVQAEPLSLDLFKHDNLLGLGSFNLDFTATGASQADIMASIDGSGGFDIADGLIKGVNIGKIARAVAQFKEGFNPAALQSAVAAARGPTEQTDFSEFLSDFTIQDGLVRAPSISLNGEYLTMAGNGTVNLPAQAIDLRLAPRASVSLDGGQTRRTVTIPLRVGGSFSKPTIAVDAEALVRSGAEKTIRDLFKGATGAKDQQQSGEETAAPPKQEEPSPFGVLEGILGAPKKQQEDTAPESSDPGEGGQTSQTSGTKSEEDLAKDAITSIFGAIGSAQNKTSEEDKAAE